MANYIVSARKYRPGTFSSVVGQSHVTNTLKSAILMDQLAHAFLFSGPRGVGKTTCARILAKAINCEDLQTDGEPCNQCGRCQSYNQGKSINIHELDAASNNSVDDIRNLIEQTRYVPANGLKSVYIIDEVHMLSQAAFNAFLKTLEEPPEHVLFILATTERHKILPTILSRCQKFDFRRIKVDDIAGHLEYIAKSEEIDYEFAALQQIALKADGALRDALSLYDQLVSFTGNKLSFSAVLENLNILDYEFYFKAVELILEQDHGQLLLLLNEIIEKGFEAKDFIVGLTEHFRNLLVCQDPKTIELLETSENVKSQYQSQSQSLDASFLLNAFHLTSEAEQKTRLAAHPRLVVELALVKLAHLQTAIKVASGTAPASTEKKKPAPKILKKQESQSEQVEEAPSVSEKPAVEKAPEAKASLEKKEATQPTADASPNKKWKGTGISGLNNLASFQAELKRKKAEAPPEKAPETEVIYSLNPSIKIAQSDFEKVFQSYIQKRKDKNNINLASALEHGKSELKHNQWQFRVGNELAFQLINRDQELLPYLRLNLKVSELFLELILDEALSSPLEEVPYTPEQKLRALSEQNPAIERLQEIFKTRIIY